MPMIVNRLAAETALNNVSSVMRSEIRRQNRKWGEQNHPDGTGPDVLALPWRLDGDETATLLQSIARIECDAAAADGTVTWRDILTEEVFEAYAEEDPEALRAELIQVAAVAVQWVMAIDRRPTDG